MSDLPEEVVFLCSSNHRVRVLTALNNTACTRRELRTITGASQPTVSRTLSQFEARYWIQRDGHQYRLTELGILVAEKLTAFLDDMETTQQLQHIWPWLPHEIDDFSIELFDDVIVAQPDSAYPYQPVERFTRLLTETACMKGFGMAIVKSANLAPFFDQVLSGMECEYIYPPAVFEELLSWNREVVLDALACGNYTVYLHDDLPIQERCGICLLDDRTSICCYDPENRTLQTIVDTGSKEMNEWAELYYHQLRADARPIDECGELISLS